MSEETTKTAEAPHNTHPEGYNEHCPECLRLEEQNKGNTPSDPPTPPAAPTGAETPANTGTTGSPSEGTPAIA